MGVRSRTAALSAVSAVLLAGSAWGASSAFGAPDHTPKNAVVFRAQHIKGVKRLVLVEGPGLVVYTFSGDHRGKPGTCTGPCASVWPQLRGVPVVAHGVKIKGKFGKINGQITFNGWPLYLFAGEKPHQNNSDGSFPVVQLR